MLPPLSFSSPVNPDDFNKASIKSRLIRLATEFWKVGENDLDGFDPLVQMLLEAFAVEFEKIGRELGHTQHRLLERLAALLNPDVGDAPHPAHAVAQAQAREALVLPDDAQFIYQPSSVGRQTAGEPVFFSPLQSTSLVPATVQYLATETTVWQMLPDGKRKEVAKAAAPPPATYRRLWLGLKLPDEGATLEYLTFYFDWLNEPHRATYAAFLPGKQWLLGEQLLTHRKGFPDPIPGSHSSEYDDRSSGQLQQEYDFLKRVEKTLKDLYAPSFVHLTGLAEGLAIYQPRPYPEELTASLKDSLTALRALTQPLVWLEVRFADALDPKAFDQLVCALNCFPVVNRRFHKVIFRLQPALNLFPLASDDAFLAMREVYSLNNVTYRSTTLRELSDGATDTYTLRTRGVSRFDNRTGRQALRELLDLLRDESQAFAAAGTDFIGPILREINQNLARLEERLDRNSGVEQPVPYILLRPQDVNDSVYLEYWSTAGATANRLPAGSRLQVHDGQYLDEVRLLTTTGGGQKRLSAEDQIYKLRHNLLARNRLVTLADIKSACWSKLGSQLSAVDVEKGFQTGATPTAGFVRCIRILLTPADSSHLNAEEWQREAEALQAELTGQSAMNLPYEVVVKQVSGR